MEWEKDPSHGEVTGSEVPLPLQEKISRYDALKTYTEFKLGAGIGLDLYMNNETYRKLTNENFDEVTVGYEMKHGPMVSANGTINFTKVDAFIAKAKEAGLTVYGHTLVWHQNQNASYLNSLIAPTIIPGTSGPNSLDLTGLKDGSFSGWARNNPGAGITLVDAAGLSSSSKALKLISSATSSAPYNLQLTTPSIPAVSGHRYEISFFIKSDQAGKGRISFDSNVTNQYPYQDWFATGASPSEAFVTTSLWQQVKFVIKDIKTGSSTFKFSFDLGYLPNVTYYIDVNNIAVVDLDAAPTVVNLISNSDFETGTLSPWSGYGNSSTRAISASGAGHGGTGYAMLLTNPTAAQNYSAQQVYTFNAPLVKGKAYTCTFWVKSDVPAALQVEIQNASYAGDYYGGINVGTTWTQVVKTITPSTDDKTKFIFDFGATAATFTIDDVVLTDGTTTGGGGSGTPPVTIEKTDAEKATIIGNSMKDWISKMVSHYKTDIFAWDVVNEPMKEDGTLRDGNDGSTATDYFSWVKYLGKDYAVTAFKLARQNGNSKDKLFINDFNLESRLDKCSGLINYVKYIESQGATVDGIGTQMHISLNTNKDKIAQMFQLLAASGKMIKVSELDISLETKDPTLDQLTAQAAMYQYVIDTYKKYIPVPQQYGITIWGISDNKEEHVNWLPDQSPNLWDANYNRKPAYKGTADGLAGKDVSLGFSGELQPKK
jgi:GH35 family endo-1,4-beta-xylanase